MIKWNGPGVLYHKGRKFKAGAEIPAGILSPDRLSEFVHSGKVKVEGEFKQQTQVVKSPQYLKAEAEANKKAEKLAKEQAEAKAKEDAENEELARMQAEEDARIAAELAVAGQA